MKVLDNKLEISVGITAIIGGGGKTSLMKSLAQELEGNVIVTTSTHMQEYDDLPLYMGDDAGEIAKLLDENRIICVAAHENEAHFKLSAPRLGFDILAGLCDYLLIEADGAKMKPLKAHASYEPVIPKSINQVIFVIGASGFDREEMTVEDVLHRPEIYYVSLGLEDLEDRPNLVRPAHYAKHVARELATGALKIPSQAKLTIFINQVEDQRAQEAASEFAKAFREEIVVSQSGVNELQSSNQIKIIAGSLHKSHYFEI